VFGSGLNRLQLIRAQSDSGRSSLHVLHSVTGILWVQMSEFVSVHNLSRVPELWPYVLGLLVFPQPIAKPIRYSSPQRLQLPFDSRPPSLRYINGAHKHYRYTVIPCT